MFAQLKCAHLHLYLCRTNGQNDKIKKSNFHIGDNITIFMWMRTHDALTSCRSFLLAQRHRLVSLPVQFMCQSLRSRLTSIRKLKGEKKNKQTRNDICWRCLYSCIDWAAANPSGIKLHNLFNKLLRAQWQKWAVHYYTHHHHHHHRMSHHIHFLKPI